MPGFVRKIVVLLTLLALPGGVLPTWHLLTCHLEYHPTANSAAHTDCGAAPSDDHPSSPFQPKPVESHSCGVCWQINHNNLASAAFCIIHTTELSPAERLTFEIPLTPARPLCLHRAQRAPPISFC